jgi:hypothetical protein
MMLPTKALLLAKEIISKMQELGVAHCDVTAENMNHNFTTGKLSVHDFSQSVLDTLHGMETFAQACGGDNEDLDEMIAWSRTEEGQRVKYVHWAGLSTAHSCECNLPPAHAPEWEVEHYLLL